MQYAKVNLDKMPPKQKKTAKKPGKKERKKKAPKTKPARTSTEVTPTSRGPGSMSFEGNLAENWNFFKQKFNIYLEATSTKNQPESYKLVLLLNTVGDEALRIFNLFYPEIPAHGLNLIDTKIRDTYGNVLEKFDEYFAKYSLPTLERFVFFGRNQGKRESLEDYLKELKSISERCRFGHLSESIVQDKTIHGILDKCLRARLIEGNYITVKQAIDIEKSFKSYSKNISVCFICDIDGECL